MVSTSNDLRDFPLRLESKTRSYGFTTYNLQWMIQNFRSLRRDRFYFGPYVQMGNVSCEFRLLTSPNGFSSNPSLKIVYMGLVPCPKFAAVTIAIQNPDGSMQREDDNLLELAPFLVNSGRFSAFEVLGNTEDLTVFYTIETNLPGNGDFICGAVLAEERCTMSANMEQLLRNGKYCDIDLVAGGRTFKAHKAILYARSNYFAEILCNYDSQELVEALAGIDSETFEELLCYIYTQKPKKYSLEISLKLFPLSIKFKLENLKFFLMDHLVGCMSVEYALQLAVNCHKQKDLELQNCALECIGNNLESALEQKHWMEFKNYEVLVDQLFRYVAKRTAKLK